MKIDYQNNECKDDEVLGLVRGGVIKQISMMGFGERRFLIRGYLMMRAGTVYCRWNTPKGGNQSHCDRCKQKL